MLSILDSLRHEIRTFRGAFYKRVARFDPHDDVTLAFHRAYFGWGIRF
jgi:hypothetical protein